MNPSSRGASMRRTLPGTAARAAIALLLALSAHAALAQRAVGIAAGYAHSLLLREDGTAWSWGDNGSGQLGDGSNAARAAPTPVAGLTGVTRVVGNSYTNFAFKSDGTIHAWGSNAIHQFADGTLLDRPSPAPFTALDAIADLAIGSGHVLALRNDGSVWAWGLNSFGQVGDGTIANRPAPVKVSGLAGVTAISAGFNQSMALTADGRVWTWGQNDRSQLGDGTTTNRASPGLVPGLTGVVAIRAGWHYMIALRIDGTVWMWGVGSGSVGPTAVPQPVPGATGVVAIAGNYLHFLAVTGERTVLAMGDNNDGQRGDGTISNPFVATVAKGLTDVVAIAASRRHSMALKSDGTVFAWGSNAFGQLGDASIVSRANPAYVAGLAGAGAVAGIGAGFQHSLVQKLDGTAAAWGRNTSRQLGDGTVVSRSSPAPVEGLAGIAWLGAGQDYSVARKPDGTVWTWGSDSFGEQGNGGGGSQPFPAAVPGLTDVTAVAPGLLHLIAQKSDGALVGWGYNQFGQVGDQTTTNRQAPVPITAIATTPAITQIGAGNYFGSALRANGSVSTFGFFGVGSVPGLSGVATLATGGSHSLALKTDGTLWAYGNNDAGQIGDGTTINRSSTPMQVSGVTDIAALAAGGKYSLALRTDGTVLGWGAGGPNGQPGNQSTPGRLPFVRNVAKLAAGGQHALALDAQGKVIAWGDNAYGQLGVPGPRDALVPTRVIDPLDPGATRGARAVAGFLNDRIGQGHHFITASYHEAQGIDAGLAGAGWGRTGRAWRAWSAQSEVPADVPALPVYRFYAAGPNSHFFTVSEQEKDALLAANPTRTPALGWALEGAVFYAVAPVLAPAGALQGNRDRNGYTCATGYYPVFRAYNNRFAFNDSNHIITSNYVDILRGLRFFGWVDEGIAFCSPRSSTPGGDLQAYHTFPGDQVPAGTPLVSEHFFTNAGPGDANGATLHAALPQEVQWTVTCEASFGAACPGAVQLAAVDDLAVGVALPVFPAGGIVKLTAKGTAPMTPRTIEFASAIDVPGGAPDPWSPNNATSISKSVVVTPTQCTATLSTPTLSATAAGTTAGSVQITLVAPAGCAWTIASTQPWTRIAPASGAGTAAITLTIDNNTLTAQRTAVVSAATVANPATRSDAQVVQAAAAAPIPATPDCVDVKLAREGEQLGPNTIQGAVALNANSCVWEARANQSWIAVTGNATGVGGGVVLYQVQANPDAAERKGAIVIANKRLDIVQAGLATLAPATGETSNGDGGGDGGGSSGGGAGSGGSGAGG